MDSSNNLDGCDGVHGESNGVGGSNGEHTSWDPAIGMSFSSADDVKSFYGKYASIKGFGWKIRSSKKGEDGEINYLILACSREGSRPSAIPCTLKTVPTKANKCPAKITSKLAEDGRWYIKTFDPNHSHEISPTKSRLFKANKKMNMHVKRTIQINDDAGMRINKTFQSLVTDAGGHDNIVFCERDVRNFVGKERRSIGKEGDAKALLSYFYQMREQNTNFFYELDLDDDFHVRNVFWADARSRATCESFGDVVTFDTTYLTNKYDMPFVAFVGVNHHGQSTLLGCGLVSSEDTDSFVWLFQSWLRCMLGKAPAGIVTDQCKAMQNAIEIVFPTTRHRWCLWHIMKKIPEKLSRYSEYKKIKSTMKATVYDTYTTADFEKNWCSFVDKFELGQNDWLSGLYKERHRWAPTLLRNHFWAGISTTQRSESIHAFFDGYINSSTSLHQLVKQYDNALRSRAEKEFEADFRSMDTIIPCGSSSSIERQFQNEYTHAKFKEVQAEFRAKMNCATTFKSVEGNVATYHVLEEFLCGDRTKERLFTVIFNRVNHDVKCECSLFEFRGILCSHVLCVCTQERVQNVPLKYVLGRWSKKIKRKHSYIKSSYGVNKMKPQVDRFDKLCKHFYEVAEVAAESEQSCKELHESLNEIKTKLLSAEATGHNVANRSNNVSVANNITLTDDFQIRSPLRVKRKGRPQSKRKISVIEKVVQKCRKRAKKSADKQSNEECNLGKDGDQNECNLHVESSLRVVTGGALLDASVMSTGVYMNTNEAMSFTEENCWIPQNPTLSQPPFNNDINQCTQVGANNSFLDLWRTSEIDFMGSSQFSTNT